MDFRSGLGISSLPVNAHITGIKIVHVTKYGTSDFDALNRKKKIQRLMKRIAFVLWLEDSRGMLHMQQNEKWPHRFPPQSSSSSLSLTHTPGSNSVSARPTSIWQQRLGTDYNAIWSIPTKVPEQWGVGGTFHKCDIMCLTCVLPVRESRAEERMDG